MDGSGETMSFLADQIEAQGLSRSHGPLIEDRPKNVEEKRNDKIRRKRKKHEHQETHPPRQEDGSDDPEHEREACDQKGRNGDQKIIDSE